ELVGGAEMAARWQREGALLTAAFQVGIAASCTERAVSYAKEREQFGRPIGSFQALKHLLADMAVHAEVARASVHAAAVALDRPGVAEAGRAVSGAKVLAGEAAVQNAKSSIQVHGGIGFTWEVDAHLYLKRALLLDTVLGSADAHAESLGRGLIPGT
ncbi:MAG: acyl-CoA dehydrogenase family protein, partial [Acidimicrobiales bacterium]